MLLANLARFPETAEYGRGTRTGHSRLPVKLRVLRADSGVAERRYGVVGAGLAGLAVIYHLLRRCGEAGQPTTFEVIDCLGIGGGASSAAVLLHPYSVRGKLMWKGKEAMLAAMQMIEAAENRAPESEQICWRNGLLFEADHPKRRQTLLETDYRDRDVERISVKRAQEILPGLLHTRPDDFYGVAIHSGCVINSKNYTKNIWDVCQKIVDSSSGRLKLTLRNERVVSCEALEQKYGPFDGVIIAAGAAVGCLPELKEKLPLRLCHGAVVHLRRGDGSSPFHGPSLLGTTYLAARGTDRVVVGGTETYNWTAEASMEELYRNAERSKPSHTLHEVMTSLHRRGCERWQPLNSWTPTDITTGVRALPPMTQLGTIPLLNFFDPNLWVVAGMGRRGLLYHALFGEAAAEAILAHDRNFCKLKLPTTS